MVTPRWQFVLLWVTAVLFAVSAVVLTLVPIPGHVSGPALIRAVTAGLDVIAILPEDRSPARPGARAVLALPDRATAFDCDVTKAGPAASQAEAARRQLGATAGRLWQITLACPDTGSAPAVSATGRITVEAGFTTVGAALVGGAG